MVSNTFCFHPYLGKIPILTNIFQMGWNHQLVYYLAGSYRDEHSWAAWMTIFRILNGPSTPGLQQGEGALHQPVIVLISAEGG